VVFNKAFLLGNLGRDPEVRSLSSGEPVATFSMATTERWKDGEGERQERTEWHQVVCYRRLAEIAGQYLRRGRMVFVEGKVRTRSWTPPDSEEKRYRTEIVARSIQMIGGSGRGEGAGQTSPEGPGDDSEPEEDDIPF
jgi:single-strand DNA-binding protein